MQESMTTMSVAGRLQPMIQQFRMHETDTGSPQVQIALLTERINQLASHFQTHKKDFNSRQGLLKMVSRRRRLLEYLKHHDEQAYRALLDALHLRK
jgi:small subunit ribosomal protein S15